MPISGVYEYKEYHNRFAAFSQPSFACIIKATRKGACEAPMSPSNEMNRPPDAVATLS